MRSTQKSFERTDSGQSLVECTLVLIPVVALIALSFVFVTRQWNHWHCEHIVFEQTRAALNEPRRSLRSGLWGLTTRVRTQELSDRVIGSATCGQEYVEIELWRLQEWDLTAISAGN